MNLYHKIEEIKEYFDNISLIEYCQFHALLEKYLNFDNI